jgi:hypothetical protein
VAGFCEHGNESFGSIEGEKFIDWWEAAYQDGYCSMELYYAHCLSLDILPVPTFLTVSSGDYYSVQSIRKLHLL